MKKCFILLVCSLSAFANDITLPEYNSVVTDVVSRGLTKESLFTRMDRKFIKVNKSICSNRALMWVNDFKRQQDVDAAKIFLFYTDKSGDVGRKTWWYHVSPMVNENGKLWVLDGGFPGWIDGPLSKEDWLKHFTNSTKCKEIKGEDTDLFERMFYTMQFPRQTKHGYYECYYRITPAGYWTPASIAMNLLGVDEDGNPVRHIRDEIDSDELLQACKEATTATFSFFGEDKCRKYIRR